MDDTTPATPAEHTHHPHVVAAAYTAYHHLDPDHTARHTARLTEQLDQALKTELDHETLVGVAGIMVLTMRLEFARHTGQLRTFAGTTA